MPTLGAPGGSADPCTATASSEPAASARTVPRRHILCVIVAFFPRRAVAGSDIGLAHDGLGGKRVRVHPHFGLHSPWAGGCPEVGKPAPVPVLEPVDVVRAPAVGTRRPTRAVRRSGEQHVAGLA